MLRYNWMLRPNFWKPVYLTFSILLFGLTSLFTTFAEEDAAPVELERIIVTPGRFTIYDGTAAKISVSKKEIERFPVD